MTQEQPTTIAVDTLSVGQLKELAFDKMMLRDTAIQNLREILIELQKRQAQPVPEVTS